MTELVMNSIFTTVGGRLLINGLKIVLVNLNNGNCYYRTQRLIGIAFYTFFLNGTMELNAQFTPVANQLRRWLVCGVNSAFNRYAYRPWSCIPTAKKAATAAIPLGRTDG